MSEETLNVSCDGEAGNGHLSRATCVVRYRLDVLAEENPDFEFAVFPDGPTLTYSRLLDRARSIGSALRKAGISQGDRVVVMLGNTRLSVEVLVSVNYIGAVAVPINPALRGNLLTHVLENCTAKVAIVDEDIIPTFLASEPSERMLIFSSAVAPAVVAENVRSIEDFLADPDAGLLELDRPIEPWDDQSIIYTSGTTGKSKGVLSSYMHSYVSMCPETWTSTKPGDRHLLHMPVYHIGGAFMVWTALRVGSSIAVVPAFKTDLFWPWVREMKVTVAFLLGAMATFLMKAEPRADDGVHGLDHVFIVPVGHSAAAFRDRFKVDVYTLFNMTEISTPLFSAKNPGKPAVCGRPREGVEVRLVGHDDVDVPDGTPGELVVRANSKWAMNHGYNGNPEATAEAWRNGWFHTGDVFVRDREGDYFFVDRLKDAIRRRGENISSYELESEILAHPRVKEAAAIGVPSDVSEDEILVCVAPIEGQLITPEEIIEHLRPRVPPYMIPRYVRVVPDLPKTPTQKVQKHLLKADGILGAVWDRNSQFKR